MTQTPEEIRADIERTRAELGADVDALADKVSPSGIAHRQGRKIRDTVDKVRTGVMGAAENAAGTVTDTAHSGVQHATGAAGGTARQAGDAARQAGEAVRNAPRQLADQARGNPLAAGLIAFGAGLLASSLIPASAKEQELAATLQEKAEPLRTEVTDAARQVAQDLKGQAQDAVQSVKETAAESAQHVKEEGTSAAADVKDRAQEARSNVQDTRSGTPA